MKYPFTLQVHKTDLTLLPARMESLVEGWLLPLWTTMSLDEIDEAIVFRLWTKMTQDCHPFDGIYFRKGKLPLFRVSATITLVISLGNWFLTGQNLETKQSAMIPLGWEAELRVLGRWGGWLWGVDHREEVAAQGRAQSPGLFTQSEGQWILSEKRLLWSW